MNSLQPFPEEFQRNLSKVAVMVYDSKVKKYPLLDAENNEIPGGGDFNRANAYKESTVLPSSEVLASELISKKAKMMPETLTEHLTDPFIALPKKKTAHNENIEMLQGDHRIATPKIIQPVTSTNKGISDRDQISKINLNKYHISEYLSETLPDDIFGPEKETWESNTSYLQTNDCDDLILWHDCNDEIEEIEE